MLLIAAATFMILFRVFLDERISVLLNSLTMLCSLLTTLSSTFLIALKIVLVTRQSPTHHTYAKIVEILTESAAIVSIFMLGTTVLDLILYVHPFDMSTRGGMFCYQLQVYLASMLSLVLGIAPTLIAFRVAEEPSHQETSATRRSGPLSRLTFRRVIRSTDTHSHAPHTGVCTTCSGVGHGEGQISGIKPSIDTAGIEPYFIEKQLL
ncbi:hypothetical protein D9619_012831 [Psilocybe cf. subviscida]|uniref:Uncharacterized protein n=1 Tax=Psilocybe cf. subviscida TaxID=2480587 RepID=A0A8H5ER31_9AGAR|nr:hypothetical protein D9619_012831 [Psilocybe cf. subviscida]